MLRPLILLAIIAALAVGVAAQPTTAQEEDTLRADWFFAFHDDLIDATSFCILWINRGGSASSGAAACHGFDNGRVAGGINPESFSFWIQQHDGTLRVEGTPPSGELGFRGTGERVGGQGEPSGGRGILGGRGSFTANLWGDMNCDSVVNSLDAYYILTKDSEECPDQGVIIPDVSIPNLMALGGDGNIDNVIDSRDALLILQVEAGLIERLPVL